jgi:hypothetical protein
MDGSMAKVRVKLRHAAGRAKRDEPRAGGCAQLAIYPPIL